MIFFWWGLFWFLIRVYTASYHGEKMQQYTFKKKVIRRADSRNPTEAKITCRPYTSSGAFGELGGVMRNFSNEGSYIETTDKYQTGTILIVRTVSYPSMLSSTAVEEQPRSFCLAEVKWCQELSDIYSNRYGIGLKYLN